MKKNKGFTLIELIAVLVIMAIIALIITPLVMNIIRKARVSADKRSIDAYGRSIELAVASYLIDTGKFPTSVEQLTIEYSGPEVVCSTTQLNSDSSVYLTGCTVAGRTVDYAYGKYEVPIYKVYSVGNEVKYNNVDYYVIKDSSATDSMVTLIKATPLTTDEINLYGGVGTENNHVNKYGDNWSNIGYAYDRNGYGGMAYYSSEKCGYVNNSYIQTECITDYEKSDVKYVVDEWAVDMVPSGLQEARLITKEEYILNAVEEEYQSSPSDFSIRYVPKYSGIDSNVDNNYTPYWFMTSYNDSTYEVYRLADFLQSNQVYESMTTVRPVIVLSKSVL